MSDFLGLKRIIQRNNSFLITTHVNPDPDALGSELALYLILKKLGKKVRIVNYSVTPYNLEFLDEEKVIEKFDEELHSNIFEEAEVLVVIDLNAASRLVKMEKGFRAFKGIKICIDHHQGTEDVFDHVFGDTNYTATAEIIYDFIEQTNVVELDYPIALQLYAGIMTDTGSFRFERTSSRIHLITAALLEKGIDPTKVYDKIYDQFNYGRIKLLGEALSSMAIDSTQQIAYMIIKRQSLERTGTTEADIDGFVNYCLTIRNIRIGILFYELNDGIKISFRSKGQIPVNKLANEYSGGGHSNAAGTRLFNVSIDEIKDKIISAAQRYL